MERTGAVLDVGLARVEKVDFKLAEQIRVLPHVVGSDQGFGVVSVGEEPASNGM
jgi:hypothetical protein